MYIQCCAFAIGVNSIGQTCTNLYILYTLFSVDSRQIIHLFGTERSKSIPCPAAHLRISHIREYLPGKGPYRLLPTNPEKPGTLNSGTEFRLRSFSIYRLSFFNRGSISTVGKALDCGVEGRGFDSRGLTNTQGLKITEK